MEHEKFTRYEKARILGARALQIAMNAPLLLKIENDDLERINFDALKIAEIELNSDVLPISIHAPMPKKKEGVLKRIKTPRISEAEKMKTEADLEKEIAEEGEIMQLAQPNDEVEESETVSNEQ